MPITDKAKAKTGAPRKGSRGGSKRRTVGSRSDVSQTEMEVAQWYMRGSGSIDETSTDRVAFASRQTGLTNEEATRCLKRKPVIQYMEVFRRRMGEVMVQLDARRMNRKFGKTEVLAHLDQLASLPPERTGNCIDGQVEALKLMANIMGLLLDTKKGAPDDIFVGRSQEELEYYSQHGRFPPRLDAVVGGRPQ